MKLIDKHVDSLVKSGMPYIDVIAYKGYDEIYRYHKGFAETTGKEKLFLYSASKPITATTAMKLVELGKVGLDDPVEKYLPAYKDAFILNSDGEKVAPKNKMTIRHLLTMTAGFSYNRDMYPIMDALAANKTETETLAAMNSLVKSPLLFEPGSYFRYSLCHDVLGAVIEAASGKRFSAVMDELILTPLGMKDTYFANPTDVSVSDMYNVLDDESIVKNEKKNNLIFKEGYESGGAGLVSTVEDYAKFAVMLASGGKTADGKEIVSEETIRKMYEKQVSGMTDSTGFTCIQGEVYDYGLGVRTRSLPTEWGLPAGEFGWDGAAGTYLMVDPVNSVSVVIGMHVLNWSKIYSKKHLEIVKLIYENIINKK